jgi:hypothetical protein
MGAGGENLGRLLYSMPKMFTHTLNSGYLLHTPKLFEAFKLIC